MPVVVDLDGTFLVVDSLRLLRLRLRLLRPHRVFASRRERARGKDALKLYLWEQAGLRVERLPVNRALLAWLEAQAAQGRTVVLATGSAQGLAEEVASHYPVFSEVIGTTPGRNLTGAAKGAALVERFGERGFDYAGDSAADLAVWAHARRAILCNVTDEVRAAVADLCGVEADLRSPARPWALDAIRALGHGWRPRRASPRADHDAREKNININLVRILYLLS